MGLPVSASGSEVPIASVNPFLSDNGTFRSFTLSGADSGRRLQESCVIIERAVVGKSSPFWLTSWYVRINKKVFQDAFLKVKHFVPLNETHCFKA